MGFSFWGAMAVLFFGASSYSSLMLFGSQRLKKLVWNLFPLVVFWCIWKETNRRAFKDKLIQDAFVSKRRLAKEYEQLAIWYGDVDIRSSQHSSLDILPSFLPATSSDLKKAQGQDSRDSEWELL